MTVWEMAHNCCPKAGLRKLQTCLSVLVPLLEGGNLILYKRRRPASKMSKVARGRHKEKENKTLGVLAVLAGPE